ncbi:MAG TPA: D-alanyl-D-alanine carboxypeptidase family protein [Thermomicrobiaceae bacterium]|nr:D-alanyl-D-alanine carboxypeptidase family protein [Thermomicrobiaceae bacterium]
MLFLVVAGLAFTVSPGFALAAAQPTVTAQYATVVDADTGAILFDKAMNTPTAPASLTKIFTAAVALDSAPLTQQLTVSQADLVGQASMGLQVGQTVSLKTALYGMLLPSGNDAAMTIASNLGAQPGDTPQQAVQNFMVRVNALTQRLGLTGTHLLNPHGLDEPGHVSTARDMAAITMYALRNPEFRTIIGTAYYNGGGFQLYQANRLLGSYPGLIGGKTGITDNAGYSLVEVAQRGGHTVIAVVMKSTATAWYEDATTLLNYGFGVLAGPAPANGWPRITLAPAAPAVAAVPAAGPVATGVPTLQVQQVAATTAVVRPAGAAAAGGVFSWRWPLAAVASMALTFAVIVNYPMVLGLGGLALGRRRRRRQSDAAGSARGATRHPRGRRYRHARHQPVVAREFVPAIPHPSEEALVAPTGVRETVLAAPSFARHSVRATAVPVSVPSHPVFDGDDDRRVVPLNAAETIASRAVRLAQRGDYPTASAEFARALRADERFDLTRTPGFWTMQPAGYVAAMRAYVQVERPAEARTLATVVQLSFGSNRDLERVARNAKAAPAV